jgi:hypothetical protein
MNKPIVINILVTSQQRPITKYLKEEKNPTHSTLTTIESGHAYEPEPLTKK